MSDNQLKKVFDQPVIQSLLFGAKEEEREVFIWRLIGGTKHLANVRIETLRKQRNDFSIVAAPGHEGQVQELLSQQDTIDLYVPESALLMRCKIRHVESHARYYLTIPEFVAQVDRRKSFRLNVYESQEVKLGFSKTMASPRESTQTFSKHCFDISSGGISFFVSRMESKFFHIHDPIRSIKVDLDGWTMKVNAEITVIKEIEPDEFNGFSYKVWRVSCRFSQIDQISKKRLEKFIFERIKEELHAIPG